MKLCRTAKFSRKFFCPQKWGMGQKQVFWSLLETFGHQFLLNLVYNENLYYLLCSCTNPILGKIPEIWAKMFSANQIAGFFNQPYLQNKSMKQPDFLHVDTNSLKLKVDQNFLGWAWSKKWVWLVSSQDSKIDCISGMHR